MRESTPFFLQTDLCEELKKLFAGQTFLTPPIEEGQEAQRKELNIHKQWLPIPDTNTAGDEITPEMIERGQVETFTAEQVFPYIVVRISEGRIEQPGANQAVNILLNFGVYDPDKSNNGYLDILHMIETIRQRFFKNPILNHRYECESKMEWALQDEESYPYNFGSLSMNFLTAPIEREDEWA